MNDWLSASEVVFGLVLEGKLSPAYVSPSLLCVPYDEGIRLLQKGKETTDVIDKIGFAPVQSARTSVVSIENGRAEEWLKLLEKSAQREQAAMFLETQSKALRRGSDLDMAKIVSVLEKFCTYGERYVTLDKVEPGGGEWMLTNYKPLDNHLGGLPRAGLTIIAAPPGVGKTSLAIKLVSKSAELNKKSLIYTFEMTLRQIVQRLIEISDISETNRKNIYATEEIMSIDEVYTDALRFVSKHGTEDFSYIVMDFADLMLEGREDEESVGYIYRKAASLAKKTTVPVLLLSQLNRNYVGGVPRIHHIRWSGLAEAMASVILLLYNPNQIWADQGKDDRLPVYSNSGYIILGKSRFGFPLGYGIGGVRVSWNGKESWGDEPLSWHPLVQG